MNRAEERQAPEAQMKVVELIASAAPLDATLEAIAEMLDATQPGMLCSILLVDDAGGRLRNAAAPALAPAYNRSVEGHPIGAQAPAWAAAAARRELVVTQDIAADPRWETHREVALQHGLRACWALPIVSSAGAVLGVIAPHYRQPASPGEREVEAVRRAASLAGIAIERRGLDTRMREAMERFELISKATNDVIRDWDLQSGRLWWNEAYSLVFGYPAAGPAGVGPSSWSERIHPEDRERVVPAMRATIDGGEIAWQSEYRFQRSDGSYAAVLDRGFVVRDPFGTAVRMVGAMMDITERKRAEEKLAWLAQYDPLTGLPNRNLMRDRLAHALRRARREGSTTAVAFIDLDRFKDINDTLGHAAGDEVLKTVAERLRGCLRERDTVARLGGDEFTAVLEDLKAREEDLPIVGRRILAALSAPVRVQGKDFSVTASIGFALYPDDGEDADTLLKRADTAMYEAKSEGRNTFERYEAEMGSGMSARVVLERRLREAVERGEFELHYQPIVRTADGSLVGTEALVRWRMQDGGIVPPAEFIPVAEASGLIVPIGEWVLQQACRDAAGWAARRDGFYVSVNLSARQFRRGGVVEAVQRALAASRLDPGRLTLEITETLLMENPEASREALAALRRLGACIALDDFGTGYSSLAYLRYFPLHSLKIDRSFVRDVTDDPGDATIVKAVVGLAHELGLGVTAEGVETPAQLAFLLAAGCEFSQGYLFGRPEPAAEFARRFGSP